MTREEGGTPQNFFLTFIDEIEKQLFKNLLKWPNKKQKNFNIYNIDFFWKNIKTPEETTILHLRTKNLDMICSF